MRQNAVEALRTLGPVTRNTVKIGLASALRDRAKRQPLNIAHMKVAAAGGFLPYLKQVQVQDFFRDLHRQLQKAGHAWRRYEEHTPLLEQLEDVGGLPACPAEVRGELVLWMTLCYLGEPGGYGTYGRGRPVFYSDKAAPVIKRLFEAAGALVRPELEQAKEHGGVKTAMEDKHVARRYEQLLDLVDQ